MRHVVSMFVVGAILSMCTSVRQANAYELLSQDWESGIGNWSVDNGVWQVGVPSAGPPTVHSGQACAGTVLNGNYPSHANTRLASPYIALPELAPGERIKLKSWNWFLLSESPYYGSDQSWIQVYTTGGSWQTIGGPITGYSATWTQMCIDLSAYADSAVRIAFYFTSNGYLEDAGWFIDDISITVEAPICHNPEDFERGVGDWSADNGLWEIGSPSGGPGGVHSGQNCFGTMLSGNYSNYADTRLISPYVTLTPEQGNFVELYYWHWFRISESIYYGNDSGWIQISADGGPWQTVAGPISGYNPPGVWTQGYVDLTPYTHSTVRIAFYLTSNGVLEDSGWYIDDVRFNNVAPIGIAAEAPFQESITLSVVPNPVSSDAVVRVAGGRGLLSLSFHDVMGRLVMRRDVRRADGEVGDIQLRDLVMMSGLPAGVYFLQAHPFGLEGQSSVATTRVVITK